MKYFSLFFSLIFFMAASGIASMPFAATTQKKPSASTIPAVSRLHYIGDNYGIIRHESAATELTVTQMIEKGEHVKALELVRTSLPSLIKADALVYEAIIYERTGDSKRARQLIMEALKSDPNNVRALVFGGYLSIASGDYVAALRAQKRAVALNPNYAPAHLGLARFYYTIGDSDSAIDAYTRVIILDKDNPDPHYERGLMYLYGHVPQPYKALDDFSTYRKMTNTTSETIDFLQGLAYAQHGDNTQAIDRLIKVPRSSTVFYLAQGVLCHVYFRSSQIDNATQSCSIVIDNMQLIKTTNPDLLKYALLHRGIILSQRRAYVEAIALFTTGISTFPKEADFYFQRAIAYHALQQDELSAKDAQRANILFFKEKL